MQERALHFSIGEEKMTEIYIIAFVGSIVYTIICVRANRKKDEFNKPFIGIPIKPPLKVKICIRDLEINPAEYQKNIERVVSESDARYILFVFIFYLSSGEPKMVQVPGIRGSSSVLGEHDPDLPPFAFSRTTGLLEMFAIAKEYIDVQGS